MTCRPLSCDSVPPGLYSSLLAPKANSVAIFYSIKTVSEESAVYIFKRQIFKGIYAPV